MKIKQKKTKKINKQINLSKQTGISLVEMLVSILVLSFGLLGLAKLQTILIKDVTLTDQRTEAANLAEAKLEELRNFEVITTAAGKFAYNDIASGTDAGIPSSNTTFNRNWVVTDSTNPDYKLVNVTVSWATASGTTENLTLSTVIAKLDPAQIGYVIHN